MKQPQRVSCGPRLIVRLQGGLGNQMFQYAAGRSLALATGRELVLDPALISRDPARHYQLDGMAIQARLADWRDRLAIRWARWSRKGLGRWSWIDESPQGLSRWSLAHQRAKHPAVMHGFWQGERYFLPHAPTIRRELQWVSPPDASNAAMLDRIGQVNAVAVHVRRGDYVSNRQFAMFHGTCGLDYYRQALELVSQRLDRPHFFVFSDDPPWARAHIQTPGPQVVVDHNLGRSDQDDLRLMAACRSLVIANSSFSWWAAYLADRPGKIVIAPARWCADENLTQRLRVASWNYLN